MSPVWLISGIKQGFSFFKNNNQLIRSLIDFLKGYKTEKIIPASSYTCSSLSAV